MPPSFSATNGLRIGEPGRDIALALETLERDVDGPARQVDTGIIEYQRPNGDRVRIVGQAQNGQEHELFDFSKQRLVGAHRHNASVIGIIRNGFATGNPLLGYNRRMPVRDSAHNEAQ